MDEASGQGFIFCVHSWALIVADCQLRSERAPLTNSILLNIKTPHLIACPCGRNVVVHV